MTDYDIRRLTNLIADFFIPDGHTEKTKREIEDIAERQSGIIPVALHPNIIQRRQPFNKSNVDENGAPKLEIPNIGLAWKHFNLSSNPSNYISRCHKLSFEGCKFSTDIMVDRIRVNEINFDECLFPDGEGGIFFSNLEKIGRLAIERFKGSPTIKIDNIKGGEDSKIDISGSAFSSLEIDNVDGFGEINLQFPDVFNPKKFIYTHTDCAELKIKNLKSPLDMILLGGINFESIDMEDCHKILIGTKKNRSFFRKKTTKVAVRNCICVDLENIEIKDAKITNSNHITFRDVATRLPETRLGENGRVSGDVNETSIVDSGHIEISGCGFESFSIENRPAPGTETEEGIIGGYLYVQNSRFEEAPEIKAKLPKGSLFNGNTFRDKSPGSIGRYGDIKKKLLDIGNDGDAMIFSSYEMISTHNNISFSDNFEEIMCYPNSITFLVFVCSLLQP